MTRQHNPQHIKQPRKSQTHNNLDKTKTAQFCQQLLPLPLPPTSCSPFPFCKISEACRQLPTPGHRSRQSSFTVPTTFRRSFGEDKGSSSFRSRTSQVFCVRSPRADSVLCVGQVKDISGATERRKGQVEYLKKYSSCQDALGLDGEPIEFEWIFSHFHFFARSKTTWRQRTSKKTSRTRSSSCQCPATLHGKRMIRIVLRMPKKSRITPRISCRDIGRTFLGPRSEEKWYGDSHDHKRTVE